MGSSMILFLFILTHTDRGMREGEVIRITLHTTTVAQKRSTPSESGKLLQTACTTQHCIQMNVYQETKEFLTSQKRRQLESDKDDLFTPMKI